MIIGRRDRERVDRLVAQVDRVLSLERELERLRTQCLSLEGQVDLAEMKVDSLKRELDRAERRADQEREDAREARRALDRDRDRQQQQTTGWMSLPPEAREDPEPEIGETPRDRYRGALARIDEVTEGGLSDAELERRLSSFRDRGKVDERAEQDQH